MVSITSNYDRGYHIVATVEQVSQDITNNTSQVRVILQINRTNQARFEQYDVGANITVDGQTFYYSGRPNMNASYMSLVLIERQITIYHNNDGTKSFNISAYLNGSGGWSPRPLSLSGSMTLGTIPRASNSITVSGDTLGNRVNVNINRLVSSFTHQVWYRVYGSDWVDLGINIATSTSFTPSLNYAEKLPNSANGVMDICVRTYSGSQQIGSDQYFYNYTMNIPGNIVPTFSGVSLIDKNVKVSSILKTNYFAQIMSDVTVQFNNARGIYGSTIKTYEAYIEGKTNRVSTNNASLGIMNYYGDFVVKAKVIDSRGRSSTITSTNIKVLEYFNPIITFDIERGGTDGQTAVVKRTIKVAPLRVDNVPKNRFTVKYEAVETNNTNKTIIGTETRSDIFTFDKANLTLTGKILATKSYEAVATITDHFGSSSYKTTIGTDKVLMSYAPTGIGIGKMHQQGTLDVGGEANFEVLKVRGNTIPSFPQAFWDGLILFLNAAERTNWQNVSFNNNWQHYDSSSYVKVSKDISRTVTLRGACKGGKTDWGTIILILPTGYRPTQNEYHRVMYGSYNQATVMIKTNGAVEIRTAITNDWVCLDGISFKV